MTYTPLQIQSGYSFFNSMIQIDQLVDRASELGFSQLALTDEAVMHGVIPFYKACLAKNIKPIIGMMVNVNIDNEIINATLLAKSKEGYKNLMKISTEIQFGKDCTLEMLTAYCEDVICIISSQSEGLKRRFFEQNDVEFKNIIYQFQEVFNDELHISVERYQESDDELMDVIKHYTKTESFSAVAIHNVRYLQQKDFLTYDCLQAMKHNEKWDRENAFEHNQQLYLRSHDEMVKIFARWPEVVENSIKIANECQVDLSFGDYHLPIFPVPREQTATEYLRIQCENALPNKYKEITSKVRERLNKELEIINNLGFNDYFLIVADFVQYAKDNNISVGPGRGSAAGSIVSYLLGITNVDPLKYDLLFERFLNPERKTMPDIDIDFADIHRDKVIEYVRNKYGQDYVAQIITFGTFGARSVLRELMKTMDIDKNDQSYILNQIPTQANNSISYYVNQSNQFKSYIKQFPSLRLLFTHAIKLEGLPRHASTHAAGVIIGRNKLTNYTPLIQGAGHVTLTQYAMNELETIGLLKIDFLGLRNLTTIDNIVKSIHYTTEKSFTLDEIPENDEKTFSLLQKAKTNGIFQLESKGMKSVLRQLLPTSFNDIVALNALYRPGPMEYISKYIARKHGKEKITIIHEDLREILEPTFGVLVYQEQIIKVAHVIAGYSLGDADVLRRAVSKKEKKLLEEQEEHFIQGSLKNGYSENIAQEIFSWIVRFANYGFNKSHSVAYSMIGYQLAYLKANYPTNFFAQMMSSVMNEPKKLKMYMNEAKEDGLNLLPLSINKSYGYFTVEKGQIRIGLMMIKGLGYESVNQIVETRKNAYFTDLFDFCLRTNLKRSVIETLIIVGALDTIYENRASLLASIDKALEFKELFGGENGQTNLFQDELKLTPEYIEMEDFPLTKKLQDEKELLQFYVSQHPLTIYRNNLNKHHFVTVQQAKQMPMKKVVKMVVYLQEIKKITTKRGDSMAFITIADETDEIEAVMFPKLYWEKNRQMKVDEAVIIEGIIEIRQQKKQIIINKMLQWNPEQYEEKKQKSLFIRINEQKEQFLTDLKKIANEYPGTTSVIMYVEQEKKSYRLSNEFSVEPINKVVNQCKQLFGDENVVLK